MWKADIDSIDFLFNLTQLQEVVLSGNPNLTHIPQHTFSHLRQLSRLDLSETGISEISDWIGSDNNLKVTLEQLSLSRNPRISDFTAIGQLSRLKDLSLQENRITDFSFLKTLVVLEELDLSFNPITKAGVDYIHHLNAVFKVIGPNLRYLSMCEMGLEDISFLKYCFTISTSSSSSSSNRSGRLEELWLSRNPLLSKGLPILSSLVSLKFLWLQSTGITDLSILTPLIRIKSLGLSRNKGPLTRLESLLKLERMDGLFLYESITNPALLLSPPVARNPCLEREAFTCRQFQEILVANIGREDL